MNIPYRENIIAFDILENIYQIKKLIFNTLQSVHRLLLIPLIRNVD